MLRTLGSHDGPWEISLMTGNKTLLTEVVSVGLSRVKKGDRYGATNTRAS